MFSFFNIYCIISFWKQLRILTDPNYHTYAKEYLKTIYIQVHIVQPSLIVIHWSCLAHISTLPSKMATNLTHSEIEEKLILKEIAKLLTSRRRLWFLEECLRINLTPNTLKVLPPNRGASLSNNFFWLELYPKHHIHSTCKIKTKA